MKGLSVIIPSKTASNLVPCVDAIRASEKDLTIRMIDDGIDLSFMPRPDWMPAYGHRGENPFVFARNCNLGIRESGEDDIILLNDDALLKTPGGFTAMQREAQQHPEYGILSATTNVAGNPSQYPQAGIGIRDEPRVVAFVCVLIPRSTIEVVGLLDEEFTSYGWDDNDYCRRVRIAGLRLGIFDGCFVDHASLRSTFRGDPHAAGDISASAAIYLAKWGDLN